MKIRAILAAAAIAALCSGCVKVNSCTADEIRAHTWRTENDDISVLLDFDGDNARLELASNGENAAIAGLCVIDDSRILILDDNNECIFGYKLMGKTITLTRDGDEIVLTADSKCSTP